MIKSLSIEQSPNPYEPGSPEPGGDVEVGTALPGPARRKKVLCCRVVPGLVALLVVATGVAGCYKLYMQRAEAEYATETLTSDPVQKHLERMRLEVVAQRAFLNDAAAHPEVKFSLNISEWWAQGCAQIKLEDLQEASQSWVVTTAGEGSRELPACSWNLFYPELDQQIWLHFHGTPDKDGLPKPAQASEGTPVFWSTGSENTSIVLLRRGHLWACYLKCIGAQFEGYKLYAKAEANSEYPNFPPFGVPWKRNCKEFSLDFKFLGSCVSCE
jgi:hypothetical protein